MTIESHPFGRVVLTGEHAEAFMDAISGKAPVVTLDDARRVYKAAQRFTLADLSARHATWPDDSPEVSGAMPRRSPKTADMIKDMQAHGREVNKTPESARAFLQRAGIVDENGELAEPYRQDAE